MIFKDDVELMMFSSDKILFKYYQDSWCSDVIRLRFLNEVERECKG